ncbi:MAG: nucleotide exchange factor GrpE [Prevotella sp.]|jgi:molecular chaperone GrpE|nr:nucleotide exchange factor GrpE [Prevotella sp.]MCI2081328.1 nucleotide exchange factor GrpE [Prevotella sp.]MCI2103184.1 nucleotide exchange factor GrpE [Prevotella sp.]
MSKEKKIKIEDGNAVEKETQQPSNNEEKQACPKGDAKQEQTDSTDEKAEDKQEADSTEEKDPLKEAQAEIETLKDKYLRTVAEFDNYKKRTLKEKAELILNGGEKTITAILPVLDDFERAIENSEKTDDIKALKEGMDLIYKKFVKTLESLGVKKIDTQDKDFDVDYHEAVAMVPGMGDEKKGKVIDCVQKGYTLNDKVIRHAKVAVGQ